MKKSIETDFWIGNKVLIKPLEKIVGEVTAIWVGFEGIQYKVSYFYNGESKEAYLRSSDLKLESNG